jgi:hypothetical protein
VAAHSVRNWVLTIAIALAACAASYGVFYAANREPAALRAAATEGDPMQWLRLEFKLTDAQYAAIQKLHNEYGAVCANHCSAIMAARERHAPSVEVRALENACVESMTDHFRRVAALMSPEEGKRYLAIVLPRIHDYDHRGAPNLEAKP